MYGDNDPEVASFFASFLTAKELYGDAPRRASPAPAPARTRRDRRNRPETDGAAVGMMGAAAILDQGSAPRGVRLRAERSEAFNSLLQEMANDIMEEGRPDIQVRSVSPRSRAPSEHGSEGEPQTWFHPHGQGGTIPHTRSLPTTALPSTAYPVYSTTLPAIARASDDESDESDESDEAQTSNIAPAWPDCSDETEDWPYPHTFQSTMPFQTTDPAWPSDKIRPTHKERKVAHSPPPPAHAALAASSRLKESDLSFAPTPSRRLADQYKLRA